MVKHWPECIILATVFTSTLIIFKYNCLQRNLDPGFYVLKWSTYYNLQYIFYETEVLTEVTAKLF